MRKTLIILSPGFPKNEQDSNCMPDRQIFIRVLKETYPELNIEVLSFQYPYNASRYQWHQVNVTSLGGRNKSGLYRRLTWRRALRELNVINTQQEVIGLLSFWLDECAFIGDKFAAKYGLKHYIWLLGQDARPGNNYVYQMMPAADNLIALSDFIAAEFNRNYGRVPKHLVPGAIDPSIFGPALAYRDIDIMAAGSLIPLKQYTVFVDIIAALKKDFPQITAVLCGDGPEMPLLQKKIKKLGLEDNLTLTGELQHDEVLVLMQRAKVFLHTSNYEGFSTVCLEALYAGAKVTSFVRPMDAPIPNLYIAATGNDMQQIATNILNDTGINYHSVLPFAMVDSAKAIVQLY